MAVRLLLCVASGILFALALPPHDAEFLGWVAFAPLLWAVAAPLKTGDAFASIRTFHAFGLGMLTGISAGVVQIGWQGSQSALTFAYVPYIWIALVLGGASALANLSAKNGSTRQNSFWFLFVACAGVFVEFLTTFSPLPVGIALCQNRNVPLIQVCSVTGIWGVSFLLWLVNAAVAQTFLLRPRRAAAAPLIGSVTLTALVWAGGFWTLSHTPSSSAQKPVTVAAVQDFSGVDAHDLAPPSKLAGDLPDSAALTRQAAAKGAQLIVGTENALGASFTPNNPKTETATLARETGAYLVVGYEADAKPHPFNCAALVAPTGNTLGVHHKLRLFLGERQTMQPGTTIQTWDSDLGKIGLLICFDTCYTGDVRQAVLNGAHLIAVPNYDPPTPGNSLHNLHAALIPFRAVENHVAVVRADPNGKSQIIDSAGRTIAESPMFEAVALVADVAPGDGQGTFFTRTGDWFAYLCTAFVAFCLCANRFVFARTKPEPSVEKETPAAETVAA